MAKRPEIRLSLGGELIPSGPNPKGQHLFLVAVRQQVPEAVEALMAVARMYIDERERQEKITSWAATWGFKADSWLDDYARQMVSLWRDSLDETQWLSMWGDLWYKHELPSVIEFLPWDPIGETESEVKARFKEYLSRVRRSTDLTPAPRKRNPHHFEWVALYHVGGLSYAGIADTYADKYPQKYNAESGIDISTVEKAVASTATLIGLTLRANTTEK